MSSNPSLARRSSAWSVELSSQSSDGDAFYDLMSPIGSKLGPPALFFTKNAISVFSPLPSASDGRIIERTIEIDQSNAVASACLISSSRAHATLVTSSSEGNSGCTLSWWNITSGELIARTHAFPFSTSKVPATLCSCLSDGFLAASNCYTISIFGSAGEEVHSLPTFSKETSGSASTISAMTWARHSSILFASVTDGNSKTRILSWSIDNDEMKQEGQILAVPDDSGPAQQLLASPDDKLMAGLDGQKVFIWQLVAPSQSEATEIQPNEAIERSGKQAVCFTWAEDKPLLAVSFGKDLVLWEQLPPTTGQEVCSNQKLYERQESEICSLAFHSSGDLLVRQSSYLFPMSPLSHPSIRPLPPLGCYVQQWPSAHL